VGDRGVGKTCLLISYSTNRMPEGYIPRLLEENNVISLTLDNDKAVDLRLIDTTTERGDVLDRTRQMAYQTADVVLLCFSVTDSGSFENIPTKWFPEMTEFNPKAKCLLIGTKTDQRNKLETLENMKYVGQSTVSVEQAEHVAKLVGAHQYIECSSFTGENLKRVFDEAVKTVVLHKKRKGRCVTM